MVPNSSTKDANRLTMNAQSGRACIMLLVLLIVIDVENRRIVDGQDTLARGQQTACDAK